MNDQLLEEIKKIDYSSITKKIEEFLENQVKASKSNGIILGLSGGIDSAVITYLCARVLKEKMLVLVLPDSKISPKEETEDALKIIDGLGLDYKLLDINLIVKEYSKYIEPNDFALGNLRARVRANLLYYYANVKNLLVVGSSDKSEFLIGYFTKFGDGSADILPIVSLYKTQVREMARFLGVPESIIKKKSSPNLWKGHVAEEEIGVRYDEIDSILYCLIEKKLSIDETSQFTNIEKSTVEKIYQMYKTSEHKRITAARP
ncbi:MAG TPA: NAD+ synthase [Nitrosopumilaceae archaeon]|jgi:NAD+ synthase